MKRVLLICLALTLGVIAGCATSSSITFKSLSKIEKGLGFDYGALTRLVIMDSQTSLKERQRLTVVAGEYIDMDVRAVDSLGNLWILPEDVKPTWTMMSSVQPGTVEMGPLLYTRYPSRMIDAASTRPVEGNAVRLQLKGGDIRSPLTLEVMLRMQTPVGIKTLMDNVEVEILSTVNEDTHLTGFSSSGRH